MSNSLVKGNKKMLPSNQDKTPHKNILSNILYYNLGIYSDMI